MMATGAAMLLSHIPATADDVRVLRLGYTMNDTSNQGRGASFFADTVFKASGGKIKVDAVGSAKMGTEAQAIGALTSGTQEMALVSTSTLVSAARGMALWDAPFLFASGTEADAILDGPIGQRVLSELSTSGVVGLAYWEFGFRQITNSQRSVGRLEDLRGLKLRVPPTLSHSFEALGAVPTAVPFPKLYSSLQSKIVDGQEHPLSVIFDSKFYEVQNHLTLSNHAYGAWVLLVAKPWWEALPVRDRELLINAAYASRSFERREARDEAARVLAALRSKGMLVTELRPAEVERMRDRVRAVRAAVAVGVSQDLWAETQARIEEIRTTK